MPLTSTRTGHTRLRAVLLIIVLAFYGAFLLTSRFAPSVLGQPLQSGGEIPVSFAVAVAIIVGSIALTGIYVGLVNRSGAR